MGETAVRLESMKTYCDIAIKLERRVRFWNNLEREAADKMYGFKTRHSQLDQIITECQNQMASLGVLSQQEIYTKSEKIQKYKKNSRIAAVCMAVMLIGVLIFSILQIGRVYQIEQKIILAVSMFFGGLTFLFLPLAVCVVVFIINSSKQKSLQREIEIIPMQNTERRKTAILSERIHTAEQERQQLCNKEKVLAEQQNELKKSSREAIMRRQEFYAIGEIPKTYQNLNAVISFFYYLDNHIVNEIEGVNGIYNKYHEDCKHREHMKKLDEIHGAILEHERHEQMRHQELMRSLRFYSTAMLGYMGSMDHKMSVKLKMDEARYKEWQEYERDRRLFNI